ncbi:hypothetical protein, partial [Streptomyces scabiei]|uniref:hypothetical protein n=1 Tax=Streptomyces scabiei TaxID=1930 RepID=UPI0038F73801
SLEQVQARLLDIQEKSDRLDELFNRSCELGIEFDPKREGLDDFIGKIREKINSIDESQRADLQAIRLLEDLAGQADAIKREL